MGVGKGIDDVPVEPGPRHPIIRRKRALKRYGLIVADNGSSWYITGAPDPRWNDEDLNQLKSVPGSAFEAVRSGPILRRG